VLVHVPSTRADFGVRIVNPDGSEAEKSGNGLRIFAKYLWDHGHATKPSFTVETPGGIVACECHVGEGRCVDVVTVEMGFATFDAAAIPMQDVTGEAIEIPIDLPSGERLSVTAVSVGNPHCVVFDGDVSEARCRALGPFIERHAAFPRRTNVQLARVVDPSTIDIRIWERGAGYTLASGSSSCAAAAAAVRTGRTKPGRLAVTMPGGTLAVHVRDDWSIRLEGPVAEVCTGALAPALVAQAFRA
jgi:diaminopimelate epimerase